MNDPNAIRGAAPSSLPKWLAKTHARYDADEVAFTPPEDGTHFLSLRLALSDEASKASPLHKSTYDKINEELGFAEQSSAGGRRLSVGKASSPRRTSGLCLSAELQSHSQDQRIESITSDDQKRYAVKPLLVIPRVFSADSGNRSSESKQSREQSKFSTSDDPHSDTEQNPEFLLEEANDKKSEHSVERANRTAQLSKDIRELKQEFKAEEGAYNIVDSVRNLFYGKSGNDGQRALGVSSPAVRKISCPQFGQGSKEFKREETQYVSSQGLVLERSAPACNSFFYRPGEVAVPKAASESQPATRPSTLPASQTGLSDSEREMAAEAAAAATVAARVRRPRPSRLREMNFWAPTSM